MSRLRSIRLARTCAIAGIICLIADHDLNFNGLDLITVALAICSVMLITKKGN